jgi:CBS domain-containing protein
MDSVRIKDYMVSQPVTVLQSATIAEAAREITDHKVSGVVGGGGGLCVSV